MEIFKENKGFNRSKINTYLFSLFLFFSIFTPGDSFGLKKFFLIVLIVLNFNTIYYFFRKKSNIYITFNVIIIPFFLLLISCIITNNIVSAIKFLYVYIFFCIIPIVEKNQIDYNRYFSNVCLLLSIFIFILFFIDIFNFSDIRLLKIVEFLNSHNESQISVSDYAIFKYVIFLYGSPLILPAFCYFFSEKKYFYSFICLGALFLSGTRANIFTGIIAFVILFLTNKENKLRFVFFFIILLFFTLFLFDSFKDKIQVINWAKAEGDSIRSLNTESILAEISKSPFNFFFGTGIGSYYFASGNGRLLNTSELSYLEFFRQVGLIGFLPVISFLLHPIKSLLCSRKYFWVSVSYVLYLCKCFFDPFLFTSTGFLFLSLVYYNYRLVKKDSYG